MRLQSNRDILSICASMVTNAEMVQGEKDLINGIEPANKEFVNEFIGAVRKGRDPLGEAYMLLNSSDARRLSGSVYTPDDIVCKMMDWSVKNAKPERVVDVGCGSGRFAMAASRAFSNAHIVAVDSSPLATLMCKANANALGIHIDVLCEDFTITEMPYSSDSRTLWIGNPPYIRHHSLTSDQKHRYRATLKELGIKGSMLAGLHSHFVATIANNYKNGDAGCLVLSSEWMDTNYGSAIRNILTRMLGLAYIETFDKEKHVFEGTMSSSVIVGFKAGYNETIDVDGKPLERTALEESSRWSDVLHDNMAHDIPEGFTQLGSYARVHRGLVTGCNRFWVRPQGDVSEELTVPVVSHARELTGKNPAFRDVGLLSRLITLPIDISELDESLREEANSIIQEGKRLGVNNGYVARQRRTWWAIPVQKPAPILMTYMARKPPTFVVNEGRVSMLNVVHGIYPTIDLSKKAMNRLVDYLNNCVTVNDGRIYAGGLAKFEPREVERLIVPSPELLEEQCQLFDQKCGRG